MVCTVALSIGHNDLRAGDRSPVLRLRQGYGACTLLWAVFIQINIYEFSIFSTSISERPVLIIISLKFLGIESISLILILPESISLQSNFKYKEFPSDLIIKALTQSSCISYLFEYSETSE
jgi:hypothetical protein